MKGDDIEKINLFEKVCFLEDKVNILTEMLMGLIEADSMRDPKINEVMTNILSYIDGMEKRDLVVSRASIVNSARKGKPPFYESRNVVEKNLNKCFENDLIVWGAAPNGGPTIIVGDFCHVFNQNESAHGDVF